MAEKSGVGSKTKVGNRAKQQLSPAQGSRGEPSDSIYSVAELVQAARSTFGVNPECVQAAFSVSGVTQATEKQARSIIKNYLNQEVE